jgi:cell wall-associated NlpC family hydrolase
MRALAHWTDAYVGIPWSPRGGGRDGCDCWGLCRLVYRDCLGIALPSYTESYATADETEEIAALIAGARDVGPWAPVEPGSEGAYDIALFRGASRLASHVGIVTKPGIVLHQMQGGLSALTTYRSGLWKHRLVGFQRHRALRKG